MPSHYDVGEHFERFIRQQVENGRYASENEVIRDALRLLEERELSREGQTQELKKQVQDGARSGPGIDADGVLDRRQVKRMD